MPVSDAFASRFSVSGYNPSAGSVGSVSAGGSGGISASSAAGGAMIAQAAIGAWNTYRLGSIAAKHTAAMSKISNERLANRQAFEMWALNEKSAVERADQVNQALDAQIVAIQQQEAARNVMAFGGQRGGTAARVLNMYEAQKERLQLKIAEQGATLATEQEIRAGRMQLDFLNQRDIKVAEKPSPMLAIGQATTEILSIGQMIRGGG